MRPAMFVVWCLGFLVGCAPDNGKINSVTVQWMDWPAEVNAGQPFRTRHVVWGVCATNPRFRAGASADESAVTFSPYFLVDDDNVLCLGASTAPLLIVAIDTAGTAPGLGATLPRTYEMRGSAMQNSLPVRTFGDVTVRPSGANPSRRNAAGTVSAERDTQGCVRVRPIGLYGSTGALVLEDQADTVGLSFAFVRGYIHDAAAPLCEETTVFHLVTRN